MYLACEMRWNGTKDKSTFLELEKTQVKFIGAPQHTRISACAHCHTGQFAFAQETSCPKTPYSADQFGDIDCSLCQANLVECLLSQSRYLCMFVHMIKQVISLVKIYYC